MTNSKVHLLFVMSFLFVSLVVSDRFMLPNHYEIKRLVPSGPNPEHSPDPPSLTTFTGHDSNINHNIKRLVPSGPNSERSPDPPSLTIPRYDSKLNYNLKRLVPSGPNSERSPDSPHVAASSNYGSNLN
ncbi:hypothetical protein K1719_012756 [Acacia pycnantha]|nr:hypothetical protein K1719_012756 [Acacia pycnantha]